MLILFLTGCSLFNKKPHTILDTSYIEKGWKCYTDPSGFSLYYPPAWKLIHGGNDYIQLYNFEPKDQDSSEMFSGEMLKTEIHWQKIADRDLEYFPELQKADGGFRLKRSGFSLVVNGISAERWTGRDVLRQAKKIMVYDPNAIRETDLTTEFVTRDMLFVIDTYTSGEPVVVPTADILLLHNSFSF